MTTTRRTELLRYGVTVPAVALATIARLALDPVLGEQFPIATLFLAILIVAGRGGRGPALLTTALGAVVAARFLVPPRAGLAAIGPENRAGLVLYLAIGGGIALLGGALRDARRRAEAGASEAIGQEERLRVTLSSIGDAVLTSDAGGRVVSMNPAAEALTGWPIAEAAGRPIAEVFRVAGEDGRPVEGDPVERALRGGVAVLPDRSVLASRVGPSTPIEGRTAPILDGGGSAIGVVAVFRDVAEERAARALLRSSEDRKAAILQTALDAIITMDHEGRIVEWNPAAERTFGHPSAAVLGRELCGVIIPPSLRDAHRRGMAHFRATGEGPILGKRFEIAAIRADGSEFPVELAVARITAEGPPLFTAHVRDITERERAEAHRERLIVELDAERRHLRTLIESSRDCIKELDLEGRVVSISQVGLRLLSLRNLCEVQDRPWVDLWHGGGREAAARAVALAVAGGVGTFEGFCPTMSGTPVWWDVVVSPILDGRGLPHRLLAVSRDVTERRRHQEERERLLAEAREANQAKDRFLAVLSHELRTPLNPILLAVTSMLERAGPPEEVRPDLEMIRRYVDLQARLIDDLLDVMRIVRGKMPLQWEVVEAHALIGQAAMICRGDAAGKELTLDLRADEHHLEADPARFQQVIWNLVKNAIKFTPEGGSISVRTHNPPAGPGSLVIEVSDTGIGIGPEVLPVIFDPFQQGEDGITRKFGGLGLGLAICRGIVEAHRGTLTAESPGEGLGTTFRVVLATVPRPTAVEAPAVVGPAEAVPSGRSSLKILMAEDEPATRHLMARLLRGQGHEVTATGTVAEAVEAAGLGAFDLVISDIGLPDGSGLDLIRRVVALRGKVPSIALTGYGMEEDLLRSREAGFSAHMTKPIDFAELGAMIRKVAP